MYTAIMRPMWAITTPAQPHMNVVKLKTYKLKTVDQIKDRKQEEFENMLADFLDNPQSSANHMVLGMSLEQREEARGHDTGNSVPNWR